MASKDKVKSLSVYVEDLKNKLKSADVPERHKHRPDIYRDWLKREISAASTKLEDIKLFAATKR
jgi:hypothetical protein